MYNLTRTIRTRIMESYTAHVTMVLLVRTALQSVLAILQQRAQHEVLTAKHKHLLDSHLPCTTEALGHPKNVSKSC
jgi:hypothetical protein